MQEEEGELREPEEDERDHRVGLDALVLRDRVPQRQETRPDGAQHDANGVRAVHRLDREPEDGQDAARDDGHVGAPEAPGGAGQDGEGHVIEDAGGAVEGDDEGDGQEAIATIPRDSRQVRPMAMIEEANCQVAALKASEIQ